MKTKYQTFLKTIIYLSMMVLLVLTISCSKDSPPEITSDKSEQLNAKAKNGKRVTKAISGNVYNFADPNQDQNTLVDCGFGATLTRNIINGHLTHLGKLQPGTNIDPRTGSFGIPISCNFNGDFTGLITVYNVFYVAANGDEFHTLEHVNITPDDASFATGTFDGTIEIIGGTGRFEGATGYLNFIDGVFGPEGSTWGLEGEITY